MVKVKIIIREFFYFFTAAFIGGLVLEIISPNIVLAYFNLNWFWLLTIIFGGLSLFYNRD